LHWCAATSSTDRPWSRQFARGPEVDDAHAAADLLRRQACALDDLDQHLREGVVVAADHRAQLRLVGVVREGR
jgi:hypothetical protein